MSSRAFRKKLEEEGDPLVKNKKKVVEKLGNDDEPPDSVNGNPFYLLNEAENLSESSEEKSGSEDKNTEPKKPKQAVQKNKKKQTQGKKENTEKKQKKVETKENNEDFDSILKEYGSGPDKRTQSVQNKIKEVALLSIQPPYLNSENEEKRLFGSQIVRQAREQRGQPGGRGRNQQQNQQPKLKKLSLVHTKPDWPLVPNDIEMVLLDSKQGINYFQVTWSADYQYVQQSFFKCVESGDPNTLMGLLEYHPYHVDSLLQLADACKITNQLDMSVDFIERILYKFETCWHPLFRPTRDTNGRLEYIHAENRSFYVAIFRHIQVLDRRGCSRTALEFCKLLLNLDHSDPLSVLLMIDTFALRSREYQFLLDLSFSTQFEENLTMLPNFVYNTAFAKFFFEKEPEETKNSIKKQGLSSNRSLLSPSELLQNAIFLFPSVIPPLLTKIGVDRVMVIDKGEHLNAIEHPFFLSTPDYPSLQPLITLYHVRNYQLWKIPEVIEWLKENIKIVLEKVISGDPMVENCRTMVAEVFLEESNQHLRHYLLSEIGEVLDTLPKLSRRGLEIYDRVDVPQEPRQAPNPLTLFLQSLLPWGDPLQQAQVQQQPGAAEWLAGVINQWRGGGHGEDGGAHQDQ